MTDIEGTGRRRTTYRHGDLEHALLEAGIEMARAGGPTAVILREATRRAGVSPNAAYRHFSDRAALLGAVCDASLSALAAAIEAEQAAVAASDDPVMTAKARFRAVGTGYVRFARAEPGLFRTAFAVPENLETAASPEKSGPSGRTPFQLLEDALDGLVEVGELPAERREGSEFLAWASVHGLATLLIDGPLRAIGDAKAELLAARLVAMVDDGM